MKNRNFMQMLRAKWAEGKFVCVGLDTDYAKIPNHLKDRAHGFVFETSMKKFNRPIADATKDLVCAYKLNSAFYEQYGALGFEVLRKTFDYIILTQG